MSTHTILEQSINPGTIAILNGFWNQPVLQHSTSQAIPVAINTSVMCQCYREKKPQILAPNATSPRQRRPLMKAVPDERGTVTGEAGRTLARTRREYLREAVVISPPVASYGKPPGLRAWGRRVGDLQERAHMREGRDGRAQGGPGKPGLTLTLPHTLNTSPPGTGTDFRRRPFPTGGLPWKYKT